jgi:hypothetical protein
LLRAWCECAGGVAPGLLVLLRLLLMVVLVLLVLVLLVLLLILPLWSLAAVGPVLWLVHHEGRGC